MSILTPSSAYNHKLAESRKAVIKDGGIYDIHTNTMQYPQIMQPTHCRWERVPTPEDNSTASLMTDLSSLTIAPKKPQSPPGDEDQPQNEPSAEPSEESPSIFPPVPKQISDQYLIQDIVYESPQYSNMGLPGPDGDLRNMHPNGLTSVANPAHPEFMTPEILALLPDECKEALVETAAAEVEWKSRWSTEATDGQRAQISRSYAWYP